MDYAVLEEWSQGSSFLHARHAAAKLLALLAVLIAISTAARLSLGLLTWFAVLLLAGVLASRLPLLSLLGRASAVLPFALTLAAASWLSGDAARAMAVIVKSYASAVAALLLVATTPMPRLLRAMESLGAPRFLLLVIQFLYRYLFLIPTEARRMMVAARCRGAAPSLRQWQPWLFRQSAGALAVLFARSYAHAEGIHRSMLSRGFSGSFPAVAEDRPGAMDVAFTLAVVAFCLAARMAA